MKPPERVSAHWRCDLRFRRPAEPIRRWHGIRKGQLARTQRRFVDLQRGVNAWSPAECKQREPHVVPLDGDALTLVRKLMQAPPLWCPFLFHGPHCAAGRKASKAYG